MRKQAYYLRKVTMPAAFASSTTQISLAHSSCDDDPPPPATRSTSITASAHTNGNPFASRQWAHNTPNPIQL